MGPHHCVGSGGRAQPWGSFNCLNAFIHVIYSLVTGQDAGKFALQCWPHSGGLRLPRLPELPSRGAALAPGVPTSPSLVTVKCWPESAVAFGTAASGRFPPLHPFSTQPGVTQREAGGKTYPKFSHEDVGDAAQNSHKVEDVPGIAKIILEWGPTRQRCQRRAPCLAATAGPGVWWGTAADARVPATLLVIQMAQCCCMGRLVSSAPWDPYDFPGPGGCLQGPISLCWREAILRPCLSLWGSLRPQKLCI